VTITCRSPALSSGVVGINARQRFGDITKAGNCLLFIDTVGGMLADLSVEIQTETVSPSLGLLGLSIACKASALATPNIADAIAASKKINKGNLKLRMTIAFTPNSGVNFTAQIGDRSENIL
jgi:hypothetical protein